MQSLFTLTLWVIHSLASLTIPHTYGLVDILLNTWEGHPSAYLQSSLCLELSPVRAPPLQTLATSVSRFSAQSPQHRESISLPLNSPPCAVVWYLPQGSEVQLEGSPHLISISQDHCPIQPVVQCLQTIIWYISSLLLVVKVKINPVCLNPSWLEVEVHQMYQD